MTHNIKFEYTSILLTNIHYLKNKKWFAYHFYYVSPDFGLVLHQSFVENHKLKSVDKQYPYSWNFRLIAVYFWFSLRFCWLYLVPLRSHVYRTSGGVDIVSWLPPAAFSVYRGKAFGGKIGRGQGVGKYVGISEFFKTIQYWV